MCKLLRYLLCCCGPSKTKLKNTQRDSKSDFTTKTTDTIWDTLQGKTYSTLPDGVEDLTRVVTIDTNIDPKASIDELIPLYQMVLKEQNYECMGNIGKGAYGVVFKVMKVSDKDNEVYAAKVMVLGIQKFDKRFEFFKRELFAMRSVNHKNIIGLHEHFVCNLYISFIILEFATKGSLKTLLRDRIKETGKPLDEKQAKVYFIQMVSGLTCLHTNRLFHGDFKLDNVLLTIDKNGKEVVKVSDFGTTRVFSNKAMGDIKRGKVMGTLTYMAPEVIHAYIENNLKNHKLYKKPLNNYNPLRADMWALGICFYELLCGERPFVFDAKDRSPENLFKVWKDMKNTKKGIRIIDPYRKQLSKDCIQILNGLIKFNRKQRYNYESLGELSYISESEYYLK